MVEREDVSLGLEWQRSWRGVARTHTLQVAIPAFSRLLLLLLLLLLLVLVSMLS